MTTIVDPERADEGEPSSRGDRSSVAATVVVPAYRAAGTIVRVLEALRDQDVGEPFEVVVVASGEDPTSDIIRRAFSEVRLLRSTERRSPGAARNAGVEAARGKVIAFLAADCVPEPDWLRRRMNAHASGHRLVAGRVDADRHPSVAEWAHYASKYRGTLRAEGEPRLGRGPLFHLSYDRATLREAGPFREDVLVGEDTILNHALVRRGERVWFDPAILVRHLGPASFREALEAHRQQGAAGGAVTRGSGLEPYFRHWLRRTPLASLRDALRVLGEVARYRVRDLGRTFVALPLIVRLLAARRSTFRRAYAGRLDPPVVAGGPVEPVPATPAEPSVSVVVAAFDEARLIGRCLASVLAQTFEPLEVIVVDDGSRDRTAEIAERHGVRVLRLAHRGPARARNAGAAAARGDVVVFVDADMELAPRSIARLVEPIQQGGTLGTFTKDLWVANAERPWAACWTLNRGFPPGHVFPPGFPDTWSNYRAVRREPLLRAGGYDDVGYGEDMTLAAKLGAPATAVPGARMWHHNPDTLGEIWQNAVWIGRGVRIREIEHVWRTYAPWRSLARGIRVARASGRPRFVPFKLVYDAGVLAGYAASHVVPRRHWK